MKNIQSTKIVLITIIALIIPFVLLATFEKISNVVFKDVSGDEQLQNKKNIFTKKTEFFANDFSNQRTLFLLGSSHVGHVNVTQVNNYISDNNITIYNLATGSDTPIERLKNLDKIISAKPEIVFYGISYRDFSFPEKNISTNIFPELQHILPTQLYKTEFFDNIFPSNPQWLTRNILNNVFNISTEEQVKIQSEVFFESNTPFYEYSKESAIATDDELKQQRTYVMTWKDNDNKNQNVYALKKIITKLHNQEIKLVVFSTPLHEYYLKSLSDSQKNQFLSLKNKLIQQYDIKIYEFENKYEGLNIWKDISHISYHNNVTEYNKDIAEMILQEINP
ncbi:MAG: hypothetical protein HOK63_05440 [Thaumarchaeota archaeon]|jgi:hypothetical protein|nr:hypothetical protein [Nitrososphaerota archaeon]MBT5842696.1 hypothetical protein [Nitrososphaerota archaeon]MBT6469074.1 hypothetical protein [Nitrososphaerota archaeon]